MALDISKFQGALKSAQASFATFQKGITDGFKKVANSADKVKDAGKAIEKAGTKVSVASGAVILLGTSAVKTASSFESAMKKVQAISGATGSDLEDLTALAREMGRATTFSASESAEALEYMALAGWDAQQMMSALPSVLKLAEATALDLATTSDVITDSMSALGLTFDELDDFVNQLAQTTVTSNTNMAQLGEAILTVGATAKSLSGDTVELNTILGVLADNGIKGSEAGTKLRNIILSLSAPTKAASKALKKLGVNAFDLDGNLRPLHEIFADLNKAMEDLSQAERDQMLSEIFNKTDLAGLNALLGTSAERFDELATAIENSEGKAEELSATMNDTAEGDLKRLQSATEDLAISFGNILIPLLREVVEHLQALTNWLNGLDGGTKEAITAVGGLVIALTPLLWILGKVVSAIGFFIGLFAEGGALALVGKAIMGILGAIAAFLGVSVGTVIAVVAVLGVAVTIIVKNWELVVELFKKSCSLIVESVTALKTKIAEKIEQIKGDIVGKVTEIKERVKSIVDKLPAPFREAFYAIVEYFSTRFLQPIKEYLKMMQASFNGLLDFIINIFSGNWRGAWQAVVNVFKSVFSGLVNIAKTPLNAIISLVNGAIRGINTMIKTLNKVPGVSIGTIPTIPRLWKGTAFAKGGITLVGEQGPELVNLNKGAQVYPAHKTRSILSGASKDLRATDGNQQTANIIVELDGRTLAKAVGQPLLDQLHVTAGLAF